MAYDYLDKYPTIEELRAKRGDAYNIAIDIRNNYRRSGGVGPFTPEDIAELDILINQFNYGTEAKDDLVRWMIKHNVMN